MNTTTRDALQYIIEACGKPAISRSAIVGFARTALHALSSQPAASVQGEAVAWNVTFLRDTGTDELIVRRADDAARQIAEHLIVSVEPLFAEPTPMSVSGAQFHEAMNAVNSPTMTFGDARALLRALGIEVTP